MHMNMHKKIEDLLGDEANMLLEHECKSINKDLLHKPSPDFIEKIFVHSNRNAQVLRSLSSLYNHGRLAGTGYLSILPVDQGIEHSAGSSFAPNPLYFDPENILKLAIEAECNAVATTMGTLAILSRKYAHKIPFIAKLNHNELLTYPNKYEQIMYGTVENAWKLGATAVGATVYFGSEGSNRQIIEVSKAFEQAHDLGMATVLWCYVRNEDFKKEGVNYETSADLTGQANHLGVSLQADIVKQKLPLSNEGFTKIGFGKSDKAMYDKLSSDHPIDMCRYQVANCYMGRIGLINSGGASKGEGDLEEVVRTAVINKRAGGTGLIVGRKSFQRPMKDGVELIQTIQDIYLDDSIGLA
jgi:fructose-bisphosphate aldolase, class I